MVLESELERDHRSRAIEAGWMVVKIMRASPNGFPDRLYLRDGRYVLIEWKRPGKPATPQQIKRHKEIRAHGGEVYVVDNVVEANRILDIV